MNLKYIAFFSDMDGVRMYLTDNLHTNGEKNSYEKMFSSDHKDAQLFDSRSSARNMLAGAFYYLVKHDCVPAGLLDELLGRLVTTGGVALASAEPDREPVPSHVWSETLAYLNNEYEFVTPINVKMEHYNTTGVFRASLSDAGVEGVGGLPQIALDELRKSIAKTYADLKSRAYINVDQNKLQFSLKGPEARAWFVLNSIIVDDDAPADEASDDDESEESSSLEDEESESSVEESPPKSSRKHKK